MRCLCPLAQAAAANARRLHSSQLQHLRAVRRVSHPRAVSGLHTACMRACLAPPSMHSRERHTRTRTPLLPPVPAACGACWHHLGASHAAAPSRTRPTVNTARKSPRWRDRRPASRAPTRRRRAARGSPSARPACRCRRLSGSSSAWPACPTPPHLSQPSSFASAAPAGLHAAMRRRLPAWTACGARGRRMKAARATALAQRRSTAAGRTPAACCCWVSRAAAAAAAAAAGAAAATREEKPCIWDRVVQGYWPASAALPIFLQHALHFSADASDAFAE